MKAVILAGGLGMRLRPFTDVLPKPLLPIGDKAILEHQLSRLSRAGVTEAFVATNYKSELIEAYLGDGSRYGLRVYISRETTPLGTAGPLRLLQSELGDAPFLVMNGDILTKLDFKRLYEFGSQNDSDLTVGTKIITTPFRFGNVVVHNDHIVEVEEKPDFKLEIVAGIYCMKPEVMNFIPAQGPYGMDSLIKSMLAAHAPVARFQIGDYWLDIGQVEDYNKARDSFDRHFGQNEESQ